MNGLQEEINKFGDWENYYQYLLTTYGETKQQKESFIKRTHTPEIQSYRGSKNTSEQQAIKGKKNTSEQQALKGKIGGKNNTSEQQSVKGQVGGKKNTSHQQSIKGKKGAIKSAKVRYEGANEQIKPWKDLGISRAWYYKQKQLGIIAQQKQNIAIIINKQIDNVNCTGKLPFSSFLLSVYG